MLRNICNIGVRGVKIIARAGTHILFKPKPFYQPPLYPLYDKITPELSKYFTLSNTYDSGIKKWIYMLTKITNNRNTTIANVKINNLLERELHATKQQYTELNNFTYASEKYINVAKKYGIIFMGSAFVISGFWYDNEILKFIISCTVDNANIMLDFKYNILCIKNKILSGINCYSAVNGIYLCSMPFFYRWRFSHKSNDPYRLILYKAKIDYLTDYLVKANAGCVGQ